MRNDACGILMVVLAIPFFAGCQQPQEAPSRQQARLLAAQNADLQEQLEARQAEIKTLQQKHAQELAKYQARIDALQRDLQTGIDERVKSVTAAVMDENTKLRQEVEQLKAEIQKLKAALSKEGSS